MTIQNIDVEATVDKVKTLIAEEKDLSPALKASLDILLLLVTLLANRLGLNSKNSSKPPSTDRNRVKVARSKSDRKPGGQKGRNGTFLQPVADPDEIKPLEVDRSTLPPGKYRVVGYEARQVIDIDISRVVTEYRAQVLMDEHCNRYVAPFPEGVTRPVQYGTGVKVNSVYMSQFQLIPYNRIEDHFLDQVQVAISAGSVYNFNVEAYDLLEPFDRWVQDRLKSSSVVHSDETGINIDGKNRWLHNASNSDYTYFYPHPKRGGEALEEIGILAAFKGILCHDHWKSYYKHYDGPHALCNAHHLRELERAAEQDKQQWAAHMIALLREINNAVHDAGGCLNFLESESYRSRYRALLQEAEVECPPPDESQRNGRRGRLARSKARSLLERLRDYESDVLRFMVEKEVPFSNNQAENDLRMTKVQQKISGCFRSWDGAKIFCRIRSYLSTCRKQGITASEALRLLFEGKSPQFMLEK